MSKKHKIIACVGHIKRKSIPKVVGASSSYVSHVFNQCGISKAEALGEEI